jgi:hypothetical protein
MTEAVARAINRAAFVHHGYSDKDEAGLWEGCKAVRIAQAQAAIETYRTYDERK